MLRRLMLPTFGLFACFSSAPVSAQVGPLGPSAPPMFGSAEAPKTFKASTAMMPSTVRYVITQNDQDTRIVMGVPTLQRDATCNVRGVSVRSMSANWTASLRGVDGVGTYTWDITGTALLTPGAYEDTWDLVNDRPAMGDVLYDAPVSVKQQITLTP